MKLWRLLGTLPKATTREEIRAASLEGWNPWKHAWSPASAPNIVLPNINSPRWPLHLKISVAGPSGSEVTFAAHWHENHDCSFYVPAAQADAGAIEATAPKYEGFWRARVDEHSELSWPTEQPNWSGRSYFLHALEGMERIAQRIADRGYSNCRVCGIRNGFESLRLEEWEWPAGYRHYVAEHHVRPTDEFSRFILEGGR